MARPAKPQGACAYCGRMMSRGGMTRHLESCEKRRAAIEAAREGAGGEVGLFHLLVQDSYDGTYWLHLEMDGVATLKKLDEYLRAIWLECCGHLSEFHAGAAYGPKVGQQRKAEEVFRPGVELGHVYDFGTSSETRVRVVGQRRGRGCRGIPSC